MKIVLATYGSRGDVQPMLALALKLKDVGHEVLLCAPTEQEAWIQSYGCAFHGLGGNLRLLFESFPAPYTLKAVFAFVQWMKEELRVQLDKLPDVLRGADLVLGASLVFGAPTAAESLGIPYRFIIFCPQVLCSSQHPSWVMRNHRLPHWLNRLSWRCLNRIDNFNFKATIDGRRRQLGLEPVNDVWDHLLGDPVIVASDALLAPVPGDVRRNYKQFGYFHLQQNGVLDKDLVAFLTSGPPPVYAGFGSMPDANPKATTRLVLEAARNAKQRVIISRGWAELGQIQTATDCWVVDDVPHMALFQRVSAVVHHGGSGTTATAARAGVPQIVIPHVLDQFYWANQIQRTGLGPKPISRPRLNVERLGTAIHECLSNQVLRQRAREIGRKLQTQDSLSDAVRFIESAFLQQRKDLATH